MIILTVLNPGCKTKEGENCLFPLVYERKTYNKCVEYDDGPWCATKLKPNNNYEEWKLCELSLGCFNGGCEY